MYFVFVADLPVAHQPDLKTDDRSLPLMFPVKMIDSTKPILIGDDPTSINLPPRKFPTASLEQNSASPPILSIADAANITALKASHESKVNVTSELPAVKTISAEGSSTIQKNVNGTEQQISEQEDMLHSKYNGGHDVDELKAGKELTEEEKKILEKDKKPSGNEKKASEKDDKKSKTPTNDKVKDPKSEFDLSSKFNSNGPKLMNETKAKAGESVLESTSKMMVVSSSVLSSTKVHKPNGLTAPSQTIISVLLSVAFILGVGVIGILVWKKISM